MYKEIIKISGLKPRTGDPEERNRILAKNHQSKLVFYTASQVTEQQFIKNKLAISKKQLQRGEIEPDKYTEIKTQLYHDALKVGLKYIDIEDFEAQMLTLKRINPVNTLSIEDIAMAVDNFPLSMSILDIAQKYFVPEGWGKVFEDAQSELKNISRELELSRKVHKIVPNNRDIFRAFYYTPLNKVRVVILGQDPYPRVLDTGEPVAMGLSFATRAGVAVQHSLQMIYQNLQTTWPFYRVPHHGDLTYWTRQGVLLLNSSLTCIHNQPASHSGKWNGFLKRVLEAILATNKNCIFVLWGKSAENIRNQFLGQHGIVVLGPHPSSRWEKDKETFLNTPYFKQVNEILISLGSNPIDWNIPMDYKLGYTLPLHELGTIAYA